MNCTINWNLNNSKIGTCINPDGSYTGNDSGLIHINIPENIRIVITAKPNDMYRYLSLTSSQKNTLRNLVKRMPADTIFYTDNAPELYEIAVNMLENSK